MIVRARQKPVEQLPEWAMCCDRTRASHMAEAGRILRVRPNSLFRGEVECGGCGRISAAALFFWRADGPSSEGLSVATPKPD